MEFTVKISWLKLFLALIFTVINVYYLIRLRGVEQRYESGIQHIRYIQGELFLVQERQSLINDTYTTTWAQQNKTAEMIHDLGENMCDKRRSLLQKKYPNVARQIENRVAPKPDLRSPWQ